MKHMQINSFLDFEYLSTPLFSPDGRFVAYVVQRAELDDNGYKGDIYLYDSHAKAHRRLTARGDAHSFVWTHDGKLLFRAMRDDRLRKRVDGGEPLACYYEISPDGGEATHAFTIPLSVGGVRPIDADRFIITATHDNALPNLDTLDDEARKELFAQRKQPPCEVIEESPFWSNGDSFTAGQRARLYLYRRSDASLTPLTGEWFDTDEFSIHGDTVLVTGVEWRGARPSFGRVGVYMINLNDCKMREVVPPGTLRISAAELWDERSALLIATGGARFGVSEYNSFYALDLQTGHYQLLTEYDYSIGYGTVGTDAKLGGEHGSKMVAGQFYFLTTIGQDTVLRRIDQDGTLSCPLTPSGSCNAFDIHGKRIVTAEMRSGLTELYLDGERLTDFTSMLNDFELSIPEKHSYTGADGFSITGYCMKPVGFDPAKTYPAILHIHGGPRTVFGDVLHHEMQVWAAAGYFVFYCNPRGSDGGGSAFGDICGKYGDVDYINIMEFCDCMLERYPQTNSAKLAVCGGSYGGFMANWIIGHTDRFACAVSQRSIANWISFEHLSDIGHGFVEVNQGTTTCQNTTEMWRQSPLAYAQNCVTPTLFIHSDGDYRCPAAEGMSMFTALKIQGVEARLVLFHGENHDLSRNGKPKNRIRRIEEIVAWFDRWLKERA